MAPASSSGATDRCFCVAASASRHSPNRRSARAPQRNCTREPPRNFSQPRRGNQSDPACSGDVGPAARGQVEVLHFDQSEHPAPGGLFSQRQRGGLLRSDETDVDRPVLPDDAVGFVHRRGHLARRRLARQIDGARVAAQVKALGPIREQPIERRRQHVLARVLLHVVETASPVDRAAHRGPFRREAPPHMSDAAVFLIDDVDHPDLAQRSDVEGLPARRRIEGRAIELHAERRRAARRRTRRAAENARVERGPVGVRCECQSARVLMSSRQFEEEDGPAACAWR